jgi:hypothetical protein
MHILKVEWMPPIVKLIGKHFYNKKISDGQKGKLSGET